MLFKIGIVKNLRFNSRSREGTTVGGVVCKDGCIVSIHAPVRERLLRAFTVFASPVSIHAPVRERHLQLWVLVPKQVSIHAPVRERLITILAASDILVSIHAPVRERHCYTQKDAAIYKVSDNFSIDNLEWPLCPNCGYFCRLPEK